MPSKKYTIFFILSVGLVLGAITFITILSQTDKKNDSAADIRAKASVTNSLKLVGSINQVDSASRVIMVEQVKFETKVSDPGDMGTWTVNVPGDYDLNSVPIGKKVYLNADASTFDLKNRTVVALAISPI